MNAVKYPRTPHLPWSLGATDDDKRLDSVEHFVGKRVVVTEKMDGENTTIYRDGMHARSLDSKDHESRHWLKSYVAGIGPNIPLGWRVCGENLYAAHSITYDNLESYFMAFSVWDSRNRCLSWPDTLEWLSLLEITPVRVICRGVFNQAHLERLAQNMMSTKEGYVVRLEDQFYYEDFGTSVAKFVRKNHVQTDQHWMHQKVRPNGLAIDKWRPVEDEYDSYYEEPPYGCGGY